MAEEPEASILIVDDDRDIAGLLEETVSIMGNYRIVTALSGKECLEIMQGDLPDLVLLDIMMRDMDGTEVCRAIKKDERTSHIPVIAVTVIQKVHVIRYREIMASGVDEYVEKPFEFEELEEIIKRHLKSPSGT